jgi:hypothetical protein
MEAQELMASFDEDRKQRNYEILINTISFLQNDGRITEDWIEENKDRITLYREAFPDFSIVNCEITDKAFRKLAAETEIIMSYLYIEVLRTRTFTVGLFLQLNLHIKALLEGVQGVDALLSMMGNMQL